MHVKHREVSLLFIFLVVGVLVFGLAPLSPLQAQADPVAIPTLYSSVSDGHIRDSGVSYEAVHDSVDGTVESERIYAGQYKYPGTYFEIYRGFVFFDTSDLPDYCTIISATLFLCTAADGSYTDFDVVIQNGQPDYPHDPMMPGDYDKTHYTGNGGFTTSELASAQNLSRATADSYARESEKRGEIVRVKLRKIKRNGGVYYPDGWVKKKYYDAWLAEQD